MLYKKQRREDSNNFITHQTLFIFFLFLFTTTPLKSCFNREMQYKARPDFHPQRTLVREDGKSGRNAVMRSLLRQLRVIRGLLACSPCHEYS